MRSEDVPIEFTSNMLLEDSQEIDTTPVQDNSFLQFEDAMAASTSRV